jgi:alcohol dehydrogenase class IV
MTMPSAVTSACGLDVVCHAAESYLSKPYNARPKPESPDVSEEDLANIIRESMENW